MKSQEQLQTVYQLWQAWREYDDQDAYQSIVETYLELVDQIVLKMMQYISNQVTFDELKSHGMIGLLDALNKFDYKRGLQFETYASLRIRGAIIDGIRGNDWIPRTLRDKAKKIEKAYQELEQIHLRSVTDDEVMNFMKVDKMQFYQDLKETSFMNCLSLDEPVDEDNEQSMLNLLSDSSEKIEEKLEKNQLKDILSTAIGKLPEKEKIVVSLYYYEELNLTEISGIIGLSTSRVSQLHTKAIYRLRGALSRQKKNIF